MPHATETPKQVDNDVKSDKPDNTNTETKDDKPKEPEVPKGSISQAKALFHKKDSDGKFQWVTEEPQDVVDAAENEETARYAFLVRKKKSYGKLLSIPFLCSFIFSLLT